MVFIARCAMMHSFFGFVSRQDCRRQSASCVCSLMGNLYGHWTLVFDLTKCARIADVPLSHAHLLRPTTAPSIFLRPVVRRPNSAATPAQTMRALHLAMLTFPSELRITALGNPALQPCLFPRFLFRQYCIGWRLPSLSILCQWCWTWLNMNCASPS